jgi:DNA primase
MTTDLLSLIGRDVTLKKISATYGGEWAGPCPMCGAGVDRLRVWPNGDRPSWWCRHCGKKGDAIQYLREHDGMSYHDACRELGQPMSHTPHEPLIVPPAACEPPPQAWRETAAGFVFWCQGRLEGALPYLASRGITERTARAAGIGYNPDGRWSERAKWGMPADDEGRTQLWLPAGIVFPWRVGESLWKVTVRRDEARADQDRYKTLPGSSNAPYNVDTLQPGRAALIVEGVFDALAVQQTAGDLISTIATGTSGARRVRWLSPLALCSPVLIGHDADAAGDKAAAYWLDVLPDSRRLRPFYDDPAAMLADGQDVRAWVRSALGGAPVAPWVTDQDSSARAYWTEEVRMGCEASLERLQRICLAQGWDYQSTVEGLR